MKKLISIILSVLFIAGPSFAEIVNEIQISGNKRVSDETVKVYGEIKPKGSDFSNSDINNILKNLYSTNFFEDVNIEIRNKKLIINLIEYPVINEIVLIGEQNTRVKNQIKKIISSKEKNSFIKNNLNKDINLIKKLYSSLGYKFSQVETKVRKIDENNVDLAINIDKGEITRISKIFFTGDKKIKDKRLRDIIASEEDKFWKVISRNTRFNENQIELDKRLLINYYKNLGYYDVKVTSSSAEIQDSENINLYYSIEAGKRYIFAKIETVLDSTFDKEIFFPLREKYNDLVGTYYSPFKIKKILEEIDIIIENKNLQFVEHSVQETIEGDKINLAFKIKEGKKIIVERINIKGNNVTNESVIRSELLLDEGDPFTNLNLDKSVAKLKSKNIFNRVKSEVLPGSSDDQKIIEISIEEKPTGELSAGAGVGTNGGTFAFDIQENNWLGEGKIVGINVELSEESLKGKLFYTNPNYDLLGNSIEYHIQNTSNDKPDQGYENKLITFGAGTSFEQYKDIYTNLSLNFSYDDLRTNSNASASLQKQDGDFTELAAVYGLTYDKRNRTFMPTDGSVFGFVQSLPIYADKPFIDNTFRFSTYHEFNENYVGSGKIFVSAINGLNDEDVRLSKRKTLSTRRLRGFSKGKIGPVDGNDHIGGNYAAAVNFDVNLPNLLPDSSNTDVSFFVDFGNVWEVDYDDSLDDSNKLRSSTGVNASWISPLGPMTFTLATNLSKASTDTTESFNFNLGTSF